MTATLPICVRGIAMSPHFIVVVISVTHSNYHKPFLSSTLVDNGLSHPSQLLEVNHLFAHTRQPSEALDQIQ